MKRTIKTIITSLLLFATVFANAQISKTNADNMVLNTIVNDTTKVVYTINETLGRGESILTAKSVELQNPYENAYVYFIDEAPAAYWAHFCKYCFVDTISGNYTLINNDIYPDNFKDYHRLSNIYAYANNALPWDGIPLQRECRALPDAHQWAVLICSYANMNTARFWGDLSCVYTTLTDCYGFIENTNSIYQAQPYFNHIIVFAPEDVIDSGPVDLNNSGGNSDNDYITRNSVYLNNGYLLYNKSSIEAVFDNLAGNSTSLSDYGYRALDSLDKLFVYVTGHGHTSNNHSYIYTGANETIYDYELADMVKDIDCSQMTFLLQSCFCGGFVDDLSNITNAKCKNRAIQAATSDSRYAHCESYINHDTSPSWPPRSEDDEYSVGEFTYYWCSALLGYYPIIRLHYNPIIGPWSVFSNNIIGSFPWNAFFNETTSLNHTQYDVSPDTNSDGVISMDEAYLFARRLDSWDTMGYFNPKYQFEENGWIAAEYPQSFYESTLTEELIALDGYKGTITNNAATGIGHKYFFDGNVTVNPNTTLTINNNCVIEGKNKILTNYGTITTNSNSNSTTYKRVKFNNVGGSMTFSHCVFDTCSTVFSCDGPLSITNSTFNNTRLHVYVDDDEIDSYNIIINNNVFNNSALSNRSLYIEKVPQCTVSGNNITSGGNGIYLSRLEGLYNNYNITNNNIHDCGSSGLVSYASNGVLNGNIISSNTLDGIQSSNLSGLNIVGDSTAQTKYDTQQLTYNGRYQVFATNNSYPQNFHYNWLTENTNSNYYILYYESNYPNNMRPLVFDVTKNCWNPLLDNQISPHLLSTGNSVFNYLPTWNPTGPVSMPDALESLFTLGNNYAENDDYDRAKEIYTEIVSDYPENPVAISALKALFSLEIASGGNFVDLKDYYSGLYSDIHLRNVADHLANRCDIKLGNYEDAIEWYENKIVDPNALLSERIFAEIDLGDLYLDIKNNNDRVIQGKLTEYIPTSKEVHEKRTDELLSLLPCDSEQIVIADMNDAHMNDNTCLKCFPNPVKEKILLSYTLNDDTYVEISLYNIMGNEVKHLNIGMQSYGSHSEVLDVSDMPNGIYFCNLKTIYGRQNTIKLVIKH